MAGSFSRFIRDCCEGPADRFPKYSRHSFICIYSFSICVPQYVISCLNGRAQITNFLQQCVEKKSVSTLRTEKASTGRYYIRKNIEMYWPPIISELAKSRRLQWAGHVALMVKKRNTQSRNGRGSCIFITETRNGFAQSTLSVVGYMF